MKKLILVLIFLIFFAGCKGGGIGGGGEPEDQTGSGLEFNFKVDRELINSRIIKYELEIENTGLEPVDLSGSKFELRTIQKDKESGYVFTSDSLDQFHNKISGEGDTILYHDNSRTYKGRLEIQEDFFKNLNNEKIDYVIDAEYTYRTKFNNNIEINVQDVEMKTDRVGQAAPVEITGMEFELGFDDMYLMEYTFEDRGPSSSEDRTVEIDGLTIQFGTQNLNGCKPYTFKNGEVFEIQGSTMRLNKNQQKIVLSCPVDVSGFEPQGWENTKTSGEFSYTYEIIKKGSINLPSNRGESIWN